MATINLVVLETEDVVVIRGLEFPGVIVQGSTLKEAKKKFDKSLGHLLEVRAKLSLDQYPLVQNERVEKVNVELLYNE